MSAVKAYLAALIFVVPIGACCAAASHAADSFDRQEPTYQLPVGCGRSSESCEVP